MSEHHSDATMTESTLPYVKLRSSLTVDSEMINELNAVLVPDEELVRIREFKTMLEEVQERRDAERSKFEEIIKRMFASHSTDGIELEASVSELRESSTRASAEWRSFEEHASIMKGMENEKFDLAKKINDQEATLSMLESEIEELRRESEVMENWDIEEEVGMDRNVYVSVKSHPKQPCSAIISRHGICSTPW